MKGITLRGMVLSKFNTVEEFSKAIGWKRSRASRIIKGEQELSMSDIIEITDVLEIESRDLFDEVFFPQLSTKWTENGK